MEGEGVSMNPRAIAIAFVLVASGGQTDEGELSVGFETTPGWYWVSNGMSSNGSFSSTFMQRFSVPVTYGLTDIWSMGINPGVSFSYFDVISNNVSINGLAGNLDSSLLWLTLPVQTSFRVNTGTNVSTVFEVFGGYSLVHWSDHFLEKDGFLALGESELPSRWKHGAVFGAQVLVEARFNDWLVVQAGPSITASYMDGWGFFPGLSIRVSGFFGVGQGFSARAE
jgi:hypothetical protein